MTEQWIVRDARRPGHYWADNEIYDIYAPIVGVHAFAVYMALCRYASSEGASHPSTSTIADQLGISRPTVVTTCADSAMPRALRDLARLRSSMTASVARSNPSGITRY